MSFAREEIASKSDARGEDQVPRSNRHGSGKGNDPVEAAELSEQETAGKDSPSHIFGRGWLWSTISRYRWALVQIVIASVFINICNLATPLFFQIVIDKVLVYFNASTLVLCVATVVIIGFFKGALEYLRAYVLATVAARLDMELSGKAFSHVIGLPMAFFVGAPAGQVVERIRDMEQLRKYVTGQGVTSTVDVVFSIVMISVLFAYSFTLSTIVLASLFVHLFLQRVLTSHYRMLARKRLAATSANQQFLIESMTGMATLKPIGLDHLLEERWRASLASRVRIEFKDDAFKTIGKCCHDYLLLLTTALILYLGARAVISGEMTVGQLLAFHMIAIQVALPVTRFASLAQDLQHVKEVLRRISQLLVRDQEALRSVPMKAPYLKGTITIQDVTFSYTSESRPVISELSLHVPEGQVVGIVGRSGSGKSTLLNLIQKLYIPQRGRILIDDVDLAEANPNWLREQIGVVTQESALFSGTIHQNIALARPNLTRSEVVQAARMAGAHDFIVKLPDGYDTFLEERGSNLSGGQRQRIAIARALAGNPRLLIFDEATSAVDAETERIIQANMRRIVSGRTVFIVGHRLAALRHADRIISMSDGQIVEDGIPDLLLQSGSGFFHDSWQLQNS